MSQEVADEHRAYIDRSAQTSPTLDMTSSVLELPRLDVPTADLSSVSTLLEGLKVSEQTSHRPPTNHEESTEKLPALDSTLRFLKPTHLPERRPSSTNTTLATATTRIVSLPETVSEYSEKMVLRQTNKKRVVSMPIKQDQLATDAAQADDNPESELSMENILPDHDRPSRIRVFSHTTDAPHTPSPPSSPESIVIIGSESQISERFIRGSACAESESPYSSGSSDDDWVNWARSPPRPIPALHGPSSLPYARCPSGAEGTIIEGQQHLPQMIWGLESEDSGRARSEPPAAPPSAPIAPSGRKMVSKPSSHNAQTKVPPRFSKPTPQLRTERQPPVTNPAPYVSFADTLPRVPQSSFNDPHALADYSNFVVPAHGPIDLNLLARPRSAIGLYPVPQGSEFSSNSAYATSGLHANSDREDLDAGWQAYPAEHDVLGSSLYSRSYGYGGADNTFQPLSSSYSVSSLSSAGTPHIMELPSQQGYSARGNSYPYSPLSTQSTPLHTPATVHQVSQRMSALEIAQKYRQKQLLQTQPSASLPTPPSSTSPLWSSGFSPYQESMWSPDVRSTGSWATASLSLASSQNRLPTPHSIGQPAARTQPPARPTVSGAVDHGSRQRSTLPIGVDSLARRVSDQPFSSNAIDLALLHTARGLTQGERRSVRPNVRASPVTGPQMSPVAPKPPPNTPLQSLTKQPTYTRPRANLTVPLSPTSPDLSSLAASRQHPRSIPLNRLIQRRLSSVAEEVRPSPEQKKPPLPPLPPLPWCEKPGTPAPRFSTPVIINADGTLSIAPRAARPPPPAYTSTDEAPTASTSLKQHAASVPTTARPNAKQGRPPNAPIRTRQHTDGGANVVNNSEQSQKNKARARNVKRGRHQTNGPERVDGGLTVHS